VLRTSRLVVQALAEKMVPLPECEPEEFSASIAFDPRRVLASHPEQETYSAIGGKNLHDFFVQYFCENIAPPAASKA
jgi:hypothetical protein